MKRRFHQKNGCLEYDTRKSYENCKCFFNDMNPALWNGEGNKPESFDERPWQYEIVDGINLEITFAYDEEDGWHHYCALVYAKDNNSFDLISGYGIDSKLNVIDTVMDICRVFK